MSKLRKAFFASLPILIVLLAIISHLSRLVAFPVFADEAIYIRWAQLIIDDWRQYLFFPMNDGKTPLFIWLLTPFQYLFSDQLFAARFVSVLIGVFQILLTKKMLAKLGATPKFQILGMLLVAVLPFWYFQAHTALMDGLLTLLLSLVTYCCLHVIQYLPLSTQETISADFKILLTRKRVIKWSLFAGFVYGLALWTKLPALFFLPIFPLFIFLPAKSSWQKRFSSLFPLGVIAFIGLGIFGLLRTSPAFGQLFSRGNDFTYSVSEVLLKGEWQKTLANIPTYAQYFLMYLTPGVVVLSVAGIFSNRTRRKTLVLLGAALFFIAPFVLFGKVIYARYLFPASIFVTLTAVLNLQAIYQHWVIESTPKQMLTKIVASLIMALILANSLATSAVFIGNLLFSPDETPFVSSDRAQYLEDWSSGQGIWETSQYIKYQAQNHTIAVATEGRFGTLPDGLLLYFHGQDVQNIYIEGTGQYPVKSLPDFFVQRAKNFEQSILVVNSNRLELKLLPSQLLGQYCRPHQKPCLQIWDITPQVKAN